jgi:DNA repair protein RadA/Sms
VGFCPQCKGRGSIRELAAALPTDVGEVPRSIAEAASVEAPRRSVGLGEVDHVLGGGLVDGAVLLLGGEPGVGKSTLLLQLAAKVAGDAPDPQVLIATGEESSGQIAMRARRIGASAAGVSVAATRRAEVVSAAVDSGEYRLVIVDSIQTMVAESIDGSAGGVGQVREATSLLIAAAKRSGTPVVLVGHVTKEGSLAGPKMIEHMVDVVMHLDGGDIEGLRFLRCLKNRYGSTDRVGVFEMTEEGMREVSDPVGCLVADWSGGAEGTVLFPSVNGKRPMLIEVQALVTASKAPQPRRSFKGLEAARVHQILAVLEKHAGISFSDQEVYVSLAGGINVKEPASDLPVALALASSRLGRPIGQIAAWGEVGLTGELRTVGRSAVRAEEVRRLGITDVISPETNGKTVVEALLHAGLTRPARRPSRLEPVS